MGDSKKLAEDEAIGQYLDHLDATMYTAIDIPEELIQLMRKLTEGVEVDLDAPIVGDTVI